MLLRTRSCSVLQNQRRRTCTVSLLKAFRGISSAEPETVALYVCSVATLFREASYLQVAATRGGDGASCSFDTLFLGSKLAARACTDIVIESLTNLTQRFPRGWGFYQHTLHWLLCKVQHISLRGDSCFEARGMLTVTSAYGPCTMCSYCAASMRMYRMYLWKKTCSCILNDYVFFF